MIHILLAEDDIPTSKFIALSLAKAGYDVTETHNGIDALKEIEKAPNRFKLLLTDIVMPGIDGIELSRKAEELCPALKVMFITGFTAIATKHQNTPSQKTKLLSKPFHLNDLIKQIETLLAE